MVQIFDIFWAKIRHEQTALNVELKYYCCPVLHWPNHSVSDKTLWLAPQSRASKLDLHFTLPWHRSEWTLCTNYSTLQPSSVVTNTYGDVCCEHLIQFLFILLLRFNTLSFYSKIQNSSAHRDNSWQSDWKITWNYGILR